MQETRPAWLSSPPLYSAFQIPGSRKAQTNISVESAAAEQLRGPEVRRYPGAGAGARAGRWRPGSSECGCPAGGSSYPSGLQLHLPFRWDFSHRETIPPDSHFLPSRKTVEPLEYYRRFLKENCRPDGRELGEFRTTTVNVGSIGTADGSSLVKLGNTTVICGIKAEFGAPPTDAPDKGYIVPNVDLSPLCSWRFRSGPPGEEAQVASQFIADVIENSQIIQKEDLCISPGKLAWVLYCDLICLNHDGNILDACTFALLAALKNVQLPEVNINEETALAEVNLKKKSYLNIRTHPVATSFAVFDDTLLIVDPTEEEEHLATGTLTVVMDEEGKLCCLHKPGGSGLTGAKLQDCMSRAVTRHKEVKKLMDEVFKSMKPK
uniref:Exosome complex component RRP43 n=1 Tax=Sus scrofa TaxID=9823 RepID=A0A8D1FL42_PIG